MAKLAGICTVAPFRPGGYKCLLPLLRHLRLPSHESRRLADAVWFGEIWHVPAVLSAGFALCAGYYFVFVRRHWRDDRIRHGMLVWTSFWVLFCLLLGFIYWISKSGGGFKIDYVDGASFSQYVNSFAQVIGIIIAASMVAVTNRHNSRNADDTARHGIYQALELESVKLFRFECEHPELVARLWYPGQPARPDLASWPQDVRDFQLREYICQILNLFEMACRFRKQRIFEAEVFGSWVIWMWELCTEAAFQRQWKDEGLEYNYVKSFRQIMNAGIHFATAQPQSAAGSSPAQSPSVSDPDRRNSFFKYVGHAVGDEAYVEHWLDRSPTDVKQFEPFWSTASKPVKSGQAG